MVNLVKFLSIVEPIGAVALIACQLEQPVAVIEWRAQTPFAYGRSRVAAPSAFPL
jgi:hypothetical protein